MLTQPHQETQDPRPPRKYSFLGRILLFVVASISGIYLFTNPGLWVNNQKPQQGSPTLNPTQITPAAKLTTTPVARNGNPIINTFPPTPTPIKFVFPTPDKAPISAWRPPLYPVPWAPTNYDHFYFIRPILADEVNWPSGNYRYGGVFFEDTVHTGIDIAAESGTPIVASGSGKVIWAGYGLYSGVASEDDPYGLAVVIRHEFGYAEKTIYTLYGHMSRVDVVRGQIVNAGDLLGHVGDTGFTTGPHLHFEVRVGDNDFFKTYNPELWVAPPQGWGILAGRVTGTGGQLLLNHNVFVKNLDTGQRWTVVSYGAGSGVNSDPYYNENLVIGDLPSGNYELTIAYLGISYKTEIWLEPGRINYFNFNGRNSFSLGPPPTPEPKFTPPPP